MFTAQIRRLDPSLVLLQYPDELLFRNRLYFIASSLDLAQPAKFICLYALEHFSCRNTPKAKVYTPVLSNKTALVELI